MGASPRVGRAGSPATNTSQHQFKMSDIRFLDSLQQRRDFQCSYLHKKGTLNSIFQSIESNLSLGSKNAIIRIKGNDKIEIYENPFLKKIILSNLFLNLRVL